MKDSRSNSGNAGLHGGNELDVRFWNDRWESGMTGWDIGYASPPITGYLSQYKNKDASILIPGCGNAYEAEYMANHDFTNVTLVDISDVAVARLKIKFKKYPQIKVLCEDFFMHRGQYDLILEQTFFCAQILERRGEYVKKMSGILKENGKLAGVLFGVNFGHSGPPFGGDIADYKKLFATAFQIKKMEPCYNSIPARDGAEIFINLVKK